MLNKHVRVFLFLAPFILLAACQQAPSISPALSGQKETLKKVAEALKASGDVQSALIIEQKIVALDQNDEKGFIDLSRSLVAARKKDEAMSVLKTGSDVVSNPDQINIQLAKLYLDDYDQKPALEALAKVKKTQDKNYYNYMGIGLDLEGDNALAQENYKKGLDIAPSDENIKNNLALSYILTGSYGAAIALLEDLVKSPTAPAKYKAKYRQNLALAYGMSGDNVKAQKNLSKDLGPEEAHENLEFYREVSSGSTPAKPKTIAVKNTAKKIPETTMPEKVMPATTPEVKKVIVPAPAKSFSTKPVSTSTKSFLGQ